MYTEAAVLCKIFFFPFFFSLLLLIETISKVRVHLVGRGEPIVLKVLTIMLCCTAHEIAKLSSKMCLTDTGLFLWCTQMVDRIAPADGIHELAVLVKSLDSFSCSLSLDSLTET